jgi:hypothetical protein
VDHGVDGMGWDGTGLEWIVLDVHLQSRKPSNWHYYRIRHPAVSPMAGQMPLQRALR